MAEARDALERLCSLYGIATGYHDIWGTWHVVPEASLVALLTEFDVDASTPERSAAAERAALVDAWREALPPVVAIRAGAACWSLPLRLQNPAARLRWTLIEEEGVRHDGEADCSQFVGSSRAEIDGAARGECRLELPVALPAGYHTLRVDGLAGETLVIAAPARCYRPPALGDSGRVWGPAVQLYALRSERNWGIGDFGDLARLIEQWAGLGADIIGVNPLHALFPHNPAHASPYSPSSRLQLNVLYLEVEAIDDFRECEEAQRLVRSAAFQARLTRLRESPLVDYPGVAAAKLEILGKLYVHFRERHLGANGPRARAFREFQKKGGAALRIHALFDALQAHFHAGDAAVWGWPAWPPACRDHTNAEVARLGDTFPERVEYHEYLQWQTRLQLARLGERCIKHGLAVGLYLDLAISVDSAGSDAWSHRECYALGASVGAPPDDFNPNGQDWGLPPLRPDRLRRSGYRLFIDTLRGCMREAGALRIDHVMGLMRLYWVPRGMTARDGAYVHYPLDEMLAIVALESERSHCMVIGEDLGTVADEMREALSRHEVLSCRLLYFERGPDGAFKPGTEYPRDALVAIGTHDLATLAGWWTGHDLRLRFELGLFPDEGAYEGQLALRAQERVRMLLALQHASLLPQGMTVEPTASQKLTPALVAAIHAFVAATPSRVMMVQLEDVVGATEQANMPGTVAEYPNWQRKLPDDIDRIANGEPVRNLARTLAAARPRSAPHPLPAPSPAVRVPRATYRLQFNRDFTFGDAARIVPYLARLGVSHVYCSPVLRARAGSRHCYDIIAHDEINPELGGREGFERFSAALRDHGMGQLLDMVPNHVGVLGADNAWWMDVLENGLASPYAHYFDIEWHPVNADLEGKVLVPALGDHYGHALASGELVLVFESASGSLALRYHEHRFPLDPGTYPVVLKRAEALLADDGARAALSSLVASFGHLPSREMHDPQSVEERTRDKAIHKGRLARLAGREPAIVEAIDTVVAEMNEAGTRDALHDLLEMQAYRLAYWRVAADEINYRRFFDINDLAALRMENEEVFEATHAFTLDLAAAGLIDGLRIDHPDGLYDPAQYFVRLQEGYARRAGLPLPECDARGRPTRPLYVVAEKITAPHEDVPDTWHLHGTTGYRFAMVVNGVLVDSSARDRLDRIWRAFSRRDEPFGEFAYSGKRAIMRSALASELTVLSTELLRIARSDRRTRDYTFNTLRQAVAEVAACLPVYRTYIVAQPSEQDLRYVNWAVARARRRSHAGDISIFDFVRRSLLGQAVEGADAGLCERVRHFAVRFQQFSAPVAAKGVEDTAFYLYCRLASLNEVGGDPDTFGISPRAFHAASADRAARWPHTILATSTHDNKRSEDVRNRINVLSELPALWRLALRRWGTLNRKHRAKLEAGAAPSFGDEYLLYQTLLGTLPHGELDEATLGAWRDRIERYMIKAAREAKENTSWISPNEEYEAALTAFVRALLGRTRPNPFLDDLRAQAGPIAWFGALNSLSMTLLKFTSPGVPDIYQGNEFMDFSLVDPDNRRAVDYSTRAGQLDALAALAGQADLAVRIGELAAAPHDGRAKLWITWRLLALRAQMPHLFRDGSYEALEADGSRAGHVLAYARRHDGTTLVVIAGRLFARLSGEPGRLPLGAAAWADTSVAVPGLPHGTPLANVLTGETVPADRGRIPLALAFRSYPGAALLVRQPLSLD